MEIRKSGLALFESVGIYKILFQISGFYLIYEFHGILGSEILISGM